LYVVAKGFERRNVENLGAIAKATAQGLAHQRVNAGEERRQSLARTGRSRNQGRAASENGWPTLFLRFGWGAELSHEPFLKQGMRPGQGLGEGSRHFLILADIRKIFAWKFLLASVGKNLLSCPFGQVGPRANLRQMADRLVSKRPSEAIL